MRDFHMNEEQALNYPTDRAFALMAFHAQHNPWCSMEPVSDAYLGQESNRLKGGAR
jgi:hypothetical protein